MIKHWASQIYSAATEVKNYLYDGGVLDSVQVSSPVISVGNLTMGGTGKTPVVDLLLSYLESKNKKTALIARNYKSRLHGFHELQRSVANGALLYGDEPWLLAQKHIGTRVYVGPVKSETLLKAHHKSPADIYVVDDGFQHRALHRDIDLVLVDGSEPRDTLIPIPLGRAREGIKNLNRADAVLLTKTEFLSDEQIIEWTTWISKYFSGPIIQLKSKINVPEVEGKKVLAFSGIARPESFEKLFREKALSFEALRFPDHHNYNQADIYKILSMARDVDLVLTTEKDWVKLAGTELGQRAQAVTLKMEIVKGEGEFYALVDSVLR